jgi:hypothetical protein
LGPSTGAQRPAHFGQGLVHLLIALRQRPEGFSYSRYLTQHQPDATSVDIVLLEALTAQ